MALMGLTSARRGIKKALAFAGRLLEKLTAWIGYLTMELLFPIPGIDILISWFGRWPFVLYPPLITGCYAFALWDVFSSKNYYFAIVLAITGTFLIAVMRSPISPDGGDGVELPDSKLLKCAEAAIAQVPDDIRAQYYEIIRASDIPVEVKKVVCAVVVFAVEGKFPDLDWQPHKILEDPAPPVKEFVTALGDWKKSNG